ncbi:chromosome partitioning protein ParB [Rhodococcus pyridinivorans]|uniref:chromosome partitioning protein ParB n=1 Tax=Rhodococcus pyridinivorans TaxID=103816 RepID=UPI001E2FE42A|nr:chromosome partitioning protein ParB [Rhodococcus pyridinivorans]MCD5418958.1 chromosome partitioning protein ParB [Rhodococcus pyridinivorans]
MARDTGFPVSDAGDDFARQRRRAEYARLIAWLRREPADVNTVLPFDDVVAALGRLGERRLGLQIIEVASIVGSVDRADDFDRRFRPTSARLRARWERIAAARRRGEAMPPISVYRVGPMHFVQDGHHRVSIAYAQGDRTIDAYVTEITTKVPAEGITARPDLVRKDHFRMFLGRVPLHGAAQDTIRVSDPWGYAELAEAVEAWGFRLMQDLGEYLTREEVARRWYEEEFVPVVAMAREAEMLRSRTDAEVYLWIASERYRLVRRHVWSEEIVDELRSRAPR